MSVKDLYKSVIFVSLTLLLLSGCFNRTQDTPFTREAAAALGVEGSPLSEPTTYDEAFTLAVPVLWKGLSENELASVAQKMETEEGLFRLKALAMYYSDDGSGMVLSRLEDKSADTGSLPWGEIKSYLSGIYGEEAIEFAEFGFDYATLFQYRITTDENIFFKVFFSAGKTWYQADYILPVSVYDKYIKAVALSLTGLKT